MYPADGVRPDEVFQAAGDALGAAKKAGRDTYYIGKDAHPTRGGPARRSTR